MRFKVIPRCDTVALIAGAAILSLWLSMGGSSASASSERSGRLHLVKDCTMNFGQPGDHCAITSSDLKQIPVGSELFYDQAGNIPAGLVDSNVVLDDMTGNGNRAVGRCTFDLLAGRGLCTFWDGTGKLTGFQARLVVVCPDSSCTVTGPYSFSPQFPREGPGERGEFR